MTNGVNVKPTLLPFAGKDFQDRIAAATPRSTCADAVPPKPQVKGVAGSPTTPDPQDLSVRRLCVCGTPYPYPL